MTKEFSELKLNKNIVSYLLDSSVLTGVIHYLVGKPGLGKTAMIKEICKEKNYGLLISDLSQLPIEDISGLPVFEKTEDNDTITRFTLPDIVNKLNILSKEHEYVFLFLDDFHLANSQVQAIGYNLLVPEPTLRGYKIPNNVRIVLAGNDSNLAHRQKISSAIVNRVSMKYIIGDLKAWISYANASGIDKTIISFLSMSSNEKYFHGEEDNTPWASPRSWTQASNELKHLNSLESSNKNEFFLWITQGYLGSEIAQQFFRHYTLYSKIPADEILKGNVGIEVPSEFSDAYIYLSAISLSYNNLITKYKNKEKAKEVIITNYSDVLLQAHEKNYNDLIMSCLKLLIVISNGNLQTSSFISLMDILNKKSPKFEGFFNKIITLKDNMSI